MDRGISVVIIGINVENHVRECIESVLQADYPRDLVEVIYVDGGSDDRSVEIAKTYGRVRVVRLDAPHPTPGRGRNAGVALAGHSVVQFLDADTVLHPAWFRAALPHLRGETAAVTGRVREKFPRKNAYHAIADIEWGVSAGVLGDMDFEGPAKVFGGIVLARKDAIVAAGGYDSSLVAGEDPDLSYRVRKLGWAIKRIDRDMVAHDISMESLRQYCRRAYRSGHAMAQIGLRYGMEEERFYLWHLLRILLGVLLPVALAGWGLLSDRAFLGLALAAVVVFRSFRKIGSLTTGLEGPAVASLYCLHLSFVIFPQFLGVLRYLITCLGGAPLRNRRRPCASP